MATGGGDLDGAFGGFHAAYICQICNRRGMRPPTWGWWRQHLHATKVIDQCQQIRRRQHVDAPGPRGLPPLRGRADQPQPRSRCRDGRRQHARYGVDAPVQRQLAKGRVFGHVLGWQDLHRRQHAQGERQVKMAALLQQISRCQIDQDALRWQGQAHSGQGRPHPLARFADCLVRQADHQEAWQAGGDLHLHRHGHRIDAGECEGADTGDRHAMASW